LRFSIVSNLHLHHCIEALEHMWPDQRLAEAIHNVAASIALLFLLCKVYQNHTSQAKYKYKANTPV
jgi:hypothetical protein